MSLVSCHCSTPQSAQRELNSRLLHGKQMGYHYTMGANWLAKLSKILLEVFNDEQSMFRCVVAVGIEPTAARL